MLESKLNSDIKAALVAKSEDLNYLRYLKSLIQDYKINLQLDRLSFLDDALVEKILSKELKKANDNLALYEANNNQVAILKTKEEIKILNRFLPDQLTEEQITEIIDEVIDGFKNDEHFSQGLVIKMVIEKTANRADNKLVATLVEKRLLK
jgi:uncharacterized protein YqeY